MTTVKTNQNPVAVLVIPTYNEAENIGKMIDYLNEKTFPSIKNHIDDLTQNWVMKVLVVDGNSPDGTGKVVEEKAKKYPNTFLYKETSKDGLGAAYYKGFKYAMEQLNADYVFEFDADFQHPPETLPSMLKAMEDGYDYVIGSRKIKGGAEPEGRNLIRTFMTEGGGLLARFILFFPFKHFWDVTDTTTGLKVTRVRGFIDHLNMDFSHLYSKKFGYKVQLLSETLAMGARFKEVPLKFANREHGVSKFESDTTTEILMSCIKTRWYDPFTQKFLKFGTVGFLGYLVNAIGLAVLSKTLGIEWLAWGLAAEVAIISNFTLNNIWTFKSSQITGISKLIKKFLQFNLSSFGAVIIQAVVGEIGVGVFHLPRQILLFFTIPCLILPYNWLMYNTFIWKKKPAVATV